MIQRMVKKLETGECFIETDQCEWEMTLRLAKTVEGHAWPMPPGHQMFNHPEKYGAVDVTKRFFKSRVKP